MIHLRLLGPLGLAAADGTEVRTVLTQPKRLALLTYLTVAGDGGFHRRDALLALFWPESNDAQARLALRQALHHLRQALGPSVIENRGAGELAIDREALTCDAIEFRRLLQERDLEGALELYRGDFLYGFSIAGISMDLEAWLEAERTALCSLAADAASALAERSARSGELGSAVQWARRALSLAPADEPRLRRLASILSLRGDRASAVRAIEQFAQQLRDQLGAELSAETANLLAELRASDSASSIANRVELGVTAATVEQTYHVHHIDNTVNQPEGELPPAGGEGRSRTAAATRRLRGRRVATACASLLALAAVVTLSTVRLHAERSAPPVLAVGWMTVDNDVGDGGAAQLLPALLETALAEVPGQRTVSDARLHDLLGQMGDRTGSESAVTRAAHLAGATELLEGTVRRSGRDRLRLDLRRVSLDDGVVLQTYHVSGRTAFELASDAAARIAADLELPAPQLRAEAPSSASLVARRFFEEGLRTYYQVDVQQSTPFFLAALREDSTCAMCAYYASLSESSDAAAKIEYARSAVRLAAGAAERERLYIRSTWSIFSGAAGLLASARKLVSRYPSDPEAHLKLAAALTNAGRFAEAIDHLRRVIDTDSLALRGAGPRCRACDAEAMLVTAYWSLDSFPAAKRAALEWVRRQPSSRSAWSILAETYMRMGRFSDARAALDSVSKLSAPSVESGESRMRLAIRSGDFAVADSYLDYRARSGTPYVRREALWWLGMSLRNQGRVREAFALMDISPPSRDSANGEMAHYPWEMARGQLLFELGRFRDAAAVYRVLAAERPAAIRDMAGVLARHRSWALAHEAEALAAAGDTAALPALIDSVEQIGAASAIGRDWSLHHHLRGLLLAARHDRTGAEAEFRAAIYTMTEGYLRTNLHLAHLLMKDGRPQAAVPLLQAALRGPLDGNGLYATHTELHELLADAFETIGESDSAAVHYRIVARAWAHGDPPFAARARRARSMLVSR
jgi:DNA-binding SARP family transcriptional activator